MALPDLLWACPECGEDRGLWNDTHTCSACGTRFVRGAGAAIRALRPDGTEDVRPAREWADRLRDPAELLHPDPDDPGASDDSDPTIVRAADVTLRAVASEESVYGEAGYLNRVEVFGEPGNARLTLEPDRLVVHGEGEAPEPWPLETLTAVQASSSSLQVKARGRPLVAFRFQDDSVYLWEQLLHAALRDFYGRTGRGEIIEFQPRITAR